MRQGQKVMNSYPSRISVLGADTGLINQFDQYRKKRNMGGYDMAGMISQKEADGMKALARQLRKEIDEWLRKHRPELMG
jgi:hypothetical protein